MNTSKRLKVKKLKVLLGPKTYSVSIGSNAMLYLESWLKKQSPQRAFIIADQKLKHPRKRLIQTLQKYQWKVHEIPVQAGEELKSTKAIEPIYSQLLQTKANRDSVLFALGGGTVGDVAGFVASTYLRGIPWVGLPTTLLAQVDSAIGGKTGLNHAEAKNCIGTIYQPSLVICETSFLKTLGLRERISGLGEMIKYGFVFDLPFLCFLKKYQKQILNLEPQITKAITTCLFWKSQVVAEDEWDQKGIREVLNFGHTFGHALETFTNYQLFQHGEAIIWGMRFALTLSWIRKKLSLKKYIQWDNFLEQLTVPALPEDLNFKALFQLMEQDKKVRNGKIRFVLLKDIGKPFTDSNVSLEELQMTLNTLKTKAALVPSKKFQKNQR